MNYVLGIDLGTTYSAMAYVNADGKSEIIANSEGERITPSAVLFEEDSVVVGTYAKTVAISEGDRVVQFIKRQMGSDYRTTQNKREYAPEEISALILRKLKQDAEAFLNTIIKDAVITVPAYFDDKRRIATKTAGEIAGLNVLRIINEPTAAALEFATSSNIDDRTIMVYDLGGGTFDITIMKIKGNKVDVIASGGDYKLGGKDIDERLIDYFQAEFQKATGLDPTASLAGQQTLRNQAELVKRTLSSSPKARVALSIEGRQANFKVSRTQFEDLIDEIMMRTEANIEILLDSVGLTTKDIQDVLLVGGSTRIPQVGTMLKRLFGKEPLRSLNPDEAVAQGAAILGSTLSSEADSATFSADPSAAEDESTPSISDVCAHSLGVVCLNDYGMEENSTIITKHSKLPCWNSEMYGTARDNQTGVDIEILQGEHPNPRECVQLGIARIADIPPSPANSPVEVIFGYDESGLLMVKGIFSNTGQSVSAKIEVQGSLSPEAARQSQEEIALLDIE